MEHNDTIKARALHLKVEGSLLQTIRGGATMVPTSEENFEKYIL